MLFNEPDDFYSVDYEDEKKKNSFFDPFNPPEENLFGKRKKINSSGNFLESKSDWVAPKIPQQNISKTESEVAPIVEQSKFKEDYSWWRKEEGYTKWLNSQNLDPNKVDDFNGNRMFKDYIKWKAENPEGFGKLGTDIAKGLGGVIQSVSDTIAEVPGLNKVVKPVGSIMQFIGNLLDLPRNVLAGAYTAVSSGNLDETFGNMWDAFKFSVGATGGNEGKDGKYFSWMDGELRNLVDKAHQGMSEDEYKKYIDSDSFRQTKRLWQTGGLLLDMVLDPAWLIGAGETKALKAMKEVDLQTNWLRNVMKQTSKVVEGVDKLETFVPFMKSDARLAEQASRMASFEKRFDKLKGFISGNDKFLDAMKLDKKIFKEMSNLELLETLTDTFSNLAKGDKKAFEYGMRLSIPFVNKATGGVLIGPSLQPLVDIVKSKIGGAERGFLSIIGRGPERARTKVDLLSTMGEYQYESNKLMGQELKKIATDIKNPNNAMAVRALEEPELFNNIVSSVLEGDIRNPGGAMLDVPIEVERGFSTLGGTETKLKRVGNKIEFIETKTLGGLENKVKTIEIQHQYINEVYKPLLEQLYTNEGILRFKHDTKKMLDASFDFIGKEETKGEFIRRAFGVNDDELIRRIEEETDLGPGMVVGDVNARTKSRQNVPLKQVSHAERAVKYDLTKPIAATSERIKLLETPDGLGKVIEQIEEQKQWIVDHANIPYGGKLSDYELKRIGELDKYIELANGPNGAELIRNLEANKLRGMESINTAPKFNVLMEEIKNSDLAGKEQFFDSHEIRYEKTEGLGQNKAVDLPEGIPKAFTPKAPLTNIKLLPNDRSYELLKLLNEPNFQKAYEGLTEADKYFVNRSLEIIDQSGFGNVQRGPLSANQLMMEKEFGPAPRVTEKRAIQQPYTPRIIDPELKDIMKAEAKKHSGLQLDDVHANQLASDAMRHIYTPVKINNEILQNWPKLFFDQKELDLWRETLRTNPQKAFVEMNSNLRRLYYVDRKSFIELTQASNIVDKFGAAVPMNKVDLAAGVTKDVEHLISLGNIPLFNELSKRGLMFEGYNGPLYKSGLETIYDKILQDQIKVERIKGVSGIFDEGTFAGWLKPVGKDGVVPKGYKLQKEGIFKGFAIQDFLETPLVNAMKGLYNMVEPAVKHNWVIEKGLQALEGFNKWWKVNIYLKNPGAHPRNFITNTVMKWGEDISPLNIFSQDAKDGRKVGTYLRAAKQYQDEIGKDVSRVAGYKQQWQKLATEKVTLAGQTITVAEAAEKMMALNVTSSGFISNIMETIHKTTDAEDRTRLKAMWDRANQTFKGKYNPFGTKDLFAKKFGAIGNFIENDLARNETFFTLVNQKGMSIADAAARVNQIFIDYNRISKTENAIRKYLIPFYTWQSRMIPNMLIKALEQPAYFTKVMQFKNNMYSILELDKNFAPMGEQVMEGIPTVALDPENVVKFWKGKNLNEVKTQYFSGEGWLPQAVVNLFDFNGIKSLLRPDVLGTDILKGVVEYGAGGMTPAIKVPLESFTGYSFQFKRMLQTYPDQTVRFLGMNLQPKQANLIRSTMGALREADDIINTWDKNAITGKPKFTVYDVLWKNLIGYRPYQRDEIREVRGALGKLKEIYMGNLSDAKRMVNDKAGQEEHAYNALMAKHGIDILDWYLGFVTEVRDKEMTAKGISDEMLKIEVRLQSQHLSKKNRSKYQQDYMEMGERIKAFLADQSSL